jgi:hypothetical protein
MTTPYKECVAREYAARRDQLFRKFSKRDRDFMRNDMPRPLLKKWVRVMDSEIRAHARRKCKRK